MGILTSQQLVDVETSGTYKALLRMNVLNQAAYWKGINGVGLADAAAAEAWFKSRSLAERILDAPGSTVDPQYWASKSMQFLKNLNLTGVTGASDMAAILTAITEHYEFIAVQTYEQERKKLIAF